MVQLEFYAPSGAIEITQPHAPRLDKIAGKKIGLLTHPAGVNRRGESTLNVLRRAPKTKLVALFAPRTRL